MADNMLKMYEAVQVNQYWEIAIRQDSIIENQALLKAFCSLEHYETVITMLIRLLRNRIIGRLRPGLGPQQLQGRQRVLGRRLCHSVDRSPH